MEVKNKVIVALRVVIESNASVPFHCMHPSRVPWLGLCFRLRLNLSFLHSLLYWRILLHSLSFCLGSWWAVAGVEFVEPVLSDLLKWDPAEKPAVHCRRSRGFWMQRAVGRKQRVLQSRVYRWDLGTTFKGHLPFRSGDRTMPDKYIFLVNEVNCTHTHFTVCHMNKEEKFRRVLIQILIKLVRFNTELVLFTSKF